MAKRDRRENKAGRPRETTAAAVEATPALERRWPVVLCAVLIVIAGVAAYANSFKGVFIFDDRDAILDNPTIRQLSNIGAVLSPPQGTTVMGRPVINLSLALNYAVGGLEVWHFHAVNLAVHILAALTLFGIVRRTLGLPALRDRFGPSATGLGAVVALIWLAHPLQTGAVTYIIQRAESMMGLFYLLTLYCFMRGATSTHSWRWYVGAVAACALGMGSKEVMVTAPIVVLLYDWNFLSGTLRRLRERWPVHAALASSWLVLILVLIVLPSSAAHGVFDPSCTPVQYAWSQCGVLLHYLRLSIWPDPLCLDYLWPVAESFGEVLPGAVVVGGLILATAFSFLQARPLAFLGCWFFLILAPTSSVVPVGDLAFEHRMYLPLAALITAGVCAVYRSAGRLLQQRGARVLGGVLAAALIAALMARTVARNSEYSSAIEMWQRVTEQRPRNPRAFVNLAFCQSKSGKLDEAITNFEKAIQIKPDYAEAHFDLANTLEKAGRSEDAVRSYEKAVQFAPNDGPNHNNLSIVLHKLKRFDEAITHAREAARLLPRDSKPLLSLGNALSGAGKREDALLAYRKALELNPGSVATRYQMGVLLDDMGERAEARACFEQVLKQKPGLAAEQNDQGIAIAKAGRLDEAIALFKKAIQLKPDFALAYNNLGNALDGTGRLEEAVAAYEQAIRHQPDYLHAHRNLADTLRKLNRADEAAKHEREAERLKK